MTDMQSKEFSYEPVPERPLIALLAAALEDLRRQDQITVIE